MGTAFGAAAGLAAIGTVVAFIIWPVRDPSVLPHSHDDLPPDDPHLVEHHPDGAPAHEFVIDERHPQWPSARV
jgi:hypothetical protein